MEQMTAEKRQLNAAYNDALTALRQMLADSREIQTLLMHMNTYACFVVTVVKVVCCSSKMEQL